MNSNRNCRWVAGVGIAVAAALIGLANAPAARADTDLDPFQDLFGDSGINTWTPAADSYLANIDPTNALAASFDTNVDNFVTVAAPPYFYGPDVVFSDLVAGLDPGAFPGALTSGNTEFLTPLDANADFALGLDYTLYASGLAPTVDPLIMDLVQVSQLPQELSALLVILGIPFGV